MDKNAIKKFAVWARTELIARVSLKGVEYGITEDNMVDANADSVGGKVLTADEKAQRKALIAEINDKGYKQVMEEVAYTWFNRFSALRFMEVNGYLPSHVRVFTDEENNFKPQIITEAIHLDLDGLDMEKVYALKEAEKTEELYKYLLIVQCNALNKILPGMFQKLSDYTELLLPDNLLREGSVIARLIEDIPEDNFDVRAEHGQIEIIGWLYQYYISEKHEDVIDPLHGKVIKKEEVPAATQLFTTDWVVRYIVDNSVGRYWIERNPNSTLKNELEYLVLPKHGELPVIKETVTPQDITVFDPCVGSGHFLIYAFDVLMKIYVEYGYTEREASREILRNNLFGLDIDNRASQLAYFAVMMKARQYDRTLFRQGIVPHIHTIIESNHIDGYAVDEFCADSSIRTDTKLLLDVFHDAKEYGSILQMPEVDFGKLEARIEEMQENISLAAYAAEDIYEIVRIAKIMSTKYVAVVTNPPYLGKYDANLKKFILDNYKDYSGDLFSVFLYRNFDYCVPNGYTGFMTPFLWMFIKTYEKLRDYVIECKDICTLIQMEYSAYEEATVPICSYVLRNGKTTQNGLYFKLSQFVGGMEVQRQKVIEGIADENCNYYFETPTELFKQIPGHPFAFWGTKNVIAAFQRCNLLADIANPRQGLITGDVNRFVRKWYECSGENLCLNATTSNRHETKRWFPYCNGGPYRKWYGNNEDVVNWFNDGEEVKSFVDEKGKQRSRPQNQQYYYCEGGTWSAISSSLFSIRYFPEGFLFSNAGMALYTEHNKLLYIIGFLNSNLCQTYLGLFNEGLNYNQGDIAKLPIIYTEKMDDVVQLTQELIGLSKQDWDSFETSWNFTGHPLCATECSFIQEAYIKWEKETQQRFDTVRTAEEQLNKIFADIYEVVDDVSTTVEDKRITIVRADKTRDIKSFISYAVGCIFGRYSLDVDGLAYAGGKWDASKYAAFEADKDNIIPICDDEYFQDDIVGRFVKFVEVVYGRETLDENLKFIADALGGKGQPKDVIRNYFINDFYTDHCKIYQKRPIYWLFDSGKKNGFKCLIYMHRYQPDTIARIRTDYVHEQQARYRTAIADLETRIAKASTSERVRLNKQLKTLNDQATEIHAYEEKIHHLADQMIPIDLDDGVKVNYAKFQDVLAKIK